MKKEFRRKLFKENDKDAEQKYINNRIWKAKKIKAVINDFGKYSGELLDIGCSLGIVSGFLSNNFNVTGIDVDEQAIGYAQQKWTNVNFFIRNGEDTGFGNELFDVVLCAGVYEHISHPEKLLSEIKRILKPDGVCYFTAMNRFILIEPHYKLPFLSYLPKLLSNAYVYIFKRETYSVKAFTLWRLRKLVSDFKLYDYTIKAIRSPDVFCALDEVSINSIKQRIALFIAKYFYFMIPTYIWLLHKNKS